jgi:putative ABC transport system substrate-binding protein
MRRREFIALAPCFVAAPRVALAQGQTKLARVAYLSVLGNERLFRTLVEALRQQGYVEGANVIIEARTARGRPEALKELATELVGLQPDVIVTVGNAASRAARSATGTIPIVFAPTGDAIGTGLVRSLARPENNLTGLSINTWVLNEKRLEVLKDSFPGVRRVSVLVNLGNPSGRAQWEVARSGGEALGFSMVLASVSSGDDLEAAFGDIERATVDALHVASDALFDATRDRVVSFADRAFAEAGGLMSYGPNLDRVSTRAAWYVD